MDYEIVITKSAEEDLDAIVFYIVETLMNKTAATHLIEAIEVVYERIAQFPDMYVLSLDSRLAALGYHRVPIQNFIMLYKVNNKRKRIYISRIFYGKQEYEKHL